MVIIDLGENPLAAIYVSLVSAHIAAIFGVADDPSERNMEMVLAMMYDYRQLLLSGYRNMRDPARTAKHIAYAAMQDLDNMEEMPKINVDGGGEC